MPRAALTALYFTLTFLAGAAVGSWILWIYLMGAPAPQSAAEPVAATPPAQPAPAAPARQPLVRESEPDAVEPTPEPAAVPEAPPEPAPKPGPTPKGHWETVDTPPRSHEECLALTKELNDAYKDCRFGVHKDVWVAE